MYTHVKEGFPLAVINVIVNRQLATYVYSHKNTVLCMPWLLSLTGWTEARRLELPANGIEMVITDN